MIQRGKLQKFIKKDHQPQSWTDDKPHDNTKDDGRDHPKQAVGETRMIIGGPVSEGSYKSFKKTYQRQINSVHIKHPTTKYQWSESDDITFFERDASGIKQPHDDSLVIMLNIKCFNTRRMLGYNGRSTGIMYMTANHQLRLDSKQLQPFKSPLVSFNGDRIYLKGIISLRVTIGTHPT